MNTAATETIRQGMVVYAARKVKSATATPCATRAQGAHVNAYQPKTTSGLPRPDSQNTIIFADASGTASLTPAAGGAALGLRPDMEGSLHQHHLLGTTIFRASSDGALETLAIILDAINITHGQPQDHTHHVWVGVDAAVDFQIIGRLGKQPLHKVTDSSHGTQALHLWAALGSLSRHIELHLVKEESHCYSLGNRTIDIHDLNQLAAHNADHDKPLLRDHMHTDVQHLLPIPNPGEPQAWALGDVIHNDTGRLYN